MSHRTVPKNTYLGIYIFDDRDGSRLLHYGVLEHKWGDLVECTTLVEDIGRSQPITSLVPKLILSRARPLAEVCDSQGFLRFSVDSNVHFLFSLAPWLSDDLNQYKVGLYLTEIYRHDLFGEEDRRELERISAQHKTLLSNRQFGSGSV